MNAPRARASARYRPLKWAPLTMNRVPGVTDWESQETSAGQQVGGQRLGRGEQAVFLQKLPVIAQRADGEVHVVTSFVGWSPQGGRGVGLRRDPADTPK